MSRRWCWSSLKPAPDLYMFRNRVCSDSPAQTGRGESGIREPKPRVPSSRSSSFIGWLDDLTRALVLRRDDDARHVALLLLP
jgi:hypothetical protein